MRNIIGDRPQTETVTAPERKPFESGYQTERIMLPLPPIAGEDTRFEMDVYVRFMRHTRHVPNSRMEIKILASIQFTADMLDTSDALVARVLVDLGLLAPRKAFPISFLDFVDKSMMRMSWDHGTPPAPAVMKLHNHWSRIGEGCFTHNIPHQYTVYNENSYAAI